jgi:hypothetical protein
MPQGDMARLFAVLTEPPVQEPVDLPRASREAALAHEVPDEVRSFSPNAARPIAVR